MAHARTCGHDGRCRAIQNLDVAVAAFRSIMGSLSEQQASIKRPRESNRHSRTHQHALSSHAHAYTHTHRRTRFKPHPRLCRAHAYTSPRATNETLVRTLRFTGTSSDSRIARKWGDLRLSVFSVLLKAIPRRIRALKAKSAAQPRDSHVIYTALAPL